MNIGPLVRASRPSTTEGRPRPGPRRPSAAACRATSSGVRSVPTWPRMPETLIIRVSDIGSGSREKGSDVQRMGGEIGMRAEEGRHDVGIELACPRRGGAPAPPPPGRATAGTRGWSSWHRTRPPPRRCAPRSAAPRPPGRPGIRVPSTRSWCDRTMRSAAGCSARNGRRIRSPRTVCSLMWSNSSGVRAAGLLSTASRIPIFPMSCSLLPSSSSASMSPV